ncbi:MAG: hypothetical protein LIO43_02590 [Clostridiales bacterium]|nr:hypothetical protein [Clostridiales bacterium]
MFGGGSVKNRNLKIRGVIACRNGSAYICVKENNRIYKITADKNGKFETSLNFKSGGNYIMIYYENFSGKTELTCKYEKI